MPTCPHQLSTVNRYASATVNGSPIKYVLPPMRPDNQSNLWRRLSAAAFFQSALAPGLNKGLKFLCTSEEM